MELFDWIEMIVMESLPLSLECHDKGTVSKEVEAQVQVWAKNSP
jgi:hypothetical protein